MQDRTFMIVGLATLLLLAGAYAGCLEFLDQQNIPKCYKGSFLCLGVEDENCHLGENQLVLHVTDLGKDRRTKYTQIGLKLENEGMAKSMIETIWVEDEYNLFLTTSPYSPIINSPGTHYRLAPNSTVFVDALAHHVPFDQHYVATCISQQKDMSLLKSVRRSSSQDQCIQNSGEANTHASTTLNFETRCTADEIEQALSLGLLRVGVQMGSFVKKPVRKAYITCQDMIEVIPYTVDGPKRSVESFDFEEDEFDSFWEEDNADWKPPPIQSQSSVAQQQ